MSPKVRLSTGNIKFLILATVVLILASAAAFYLLKPVAISEKTVSINSESEVYLSDSKTMAGVRLSFSGFNEKGDISHYEIRWKTAQPVYGEGEPDALGPASLYEPLTRLFDRREKLEGWLGSDGGSSTRLSDGRDAWAFSDSVIGTADKEGRMNGWSMVRNCLIFTNTEGDDPEYFEDVIGVPNQLSVDDAGFVNSIGKWNADNAALSLTDEQAAFGDNSMKVEISADGDAALDNGKGKDGINNIKGQHVTAKAMIRAQKEQKVRIGIEYYDVFSKLVSKDESDDITVTDSNWTRLSYTSEIAPDDAVFASISIRLVNCKAGDVFYIANCGLYKGDASMQSWSLPGKGWKYENLVNPEEVNLVKADDVTSDWFWFSGAVSIGSKLYVFMNHYGHNDGIPPWNFEFRNNQYLGQWDTETNTFEDIFEWSKDDPVQWGSSYLKDDGYLYILGYIERDHYLVRVPEDNIFGEKEFWTGEAWSKKREDAKMLVELKEFGGNMDGICKLNGKYQAVYMETFGRQIKRLEADAITGPWVDTNEVLYDMAGSGDGLYGYIPRIHNQFTSQEGIVMSYSSGGSINDESLITYSSYKFAIGPSVEPDTADFDDNWDKIIKTEKGSHEFVIDNLDQGCDLVVEVRAVYKNFRKSKWIESAPIRTAVDKTPPPQPCAPVVEINDEHKLVVEWDGGFVDGIETQGSSNEAQGNSNRDDFSHIEIHVSESSNFIPAYWTMYGTLSEKGSVTIDKPLMENRNYYIRLVAVDYSGNKSEISEQSKVFG